MKKRIMVIDGHVGNLNYLKQLFSISDVETIAFTDLKSAKESVQLHTPNAILANMTLGKEPLTEFMSWLRGSKVGQYIAVFLILPQTKDYRNGAILQQRFGIQKIIPRPINPPSLLRDILRPLQVPVPDRHMIPPPECTIEIPDSGSLTEHPLVELLAYCFQHDKTGILRVETQKYSLFLGFNQGKLLFVNSSYMPNFSLAEYLDREKLLTSSQISIATEKAEQQGRLLGEVIAAMGFLDSRTLFESVGKQMQMKVVSTMELTEGDYSFQEQDIRTDAHFYPLLRVPMLIRLGLPKLDIKTTITKSIRDSLGEIIYPSLIRSFDPRDLIQNRGEETVYSLLDGARTIKDILQMAGQNRESAIRYIYYLYIIGAISFQDESLTLSDSYQGMRVSMSEEVPSPESVRDESYVPPAVTQSRILYYPEGTEEFRPIIEGKVAREILGITVEIPTKDDLDIAFSDRMLSLGRLAVKSLTLYEKAVRKVNTAYAKLSENLSVDGPELLKDRSTRKMEAHRSETQKAMAQDHYNKGLQMLNKNFFELAEKEFVQAENIDPSKGEYSAYRAWALYNRPNLPNRKDIREEVHRLMREAIGKDQYCAESRFLMGRIYMEEKSYDKAAKEFMMTAPHLLIGPSLALFLFVLSANLVGDALQETLNPKLNKRK